MQGTVPVLKYGAFQGAIDTAIEQHSDDASKHPHIGTLASRVALEDAISVVNIVSERPRISVYHSGQHLNIGVSSYLDLADKPQASDVGALAIDRLGVDVAELVSGLIPTSRLPQLAISKPLPVASQAAMLALDAQYGDVAVRSDTNERFILGGDGNPATLANWILLGLSTDQVVSVNGETGVVVLDASDVGAYSIAGANAAFKPITELSGHQVLNEGTPVLQRGKMRFTGGGVNVVDNPTTGETEVQISGATVGAASEDEPGTAEFATLAEILAVDTNNLTANDLARMVSAGRLMQALEQRSPAGIIEEYSGFSLPTGFLWADWSSVSRTTYARLFNAITYTRTGNTTSASTSVSSVSALPSGAPVFIGCPVEGPGIPTGTTVAAFTANTITLSQAATATASGITMRFLPWGFGATTSEFRTPDRRGRMGIGAGTGADQAGANPLTARILGVKGGKETHLLTGPESGIQAHSHTLANAGGQTSADGTNKTLANSSAGTTGTTGPSDATSAHENMSPFIVCNYIVRY